MTKKIIFGLLACAGLTFTACKDEVELDLQGELQEENLPKSQAFIDSQVVSVYGMLDGNLTIGNPWRAAASNWVYGEVVSDNAYKGSDPGDQATITEMETFVTNPNNIYLDDKWRAVYEGVSRANVAIRAIQVALDEGVLNDSVANNYISEARFLRGHFHFEAKKMWGNVPYIDENAVESVSNVDDNTWNGIEADFTFAADNLIDTPLRPGGATSWSAKVYLAKAHMYQLDDDAARPLLDEVINSSVYALNTNFHDNFDGTTINSIESVFSVLYATDDGTPNENNSNQGDVLNYPHEFSNPVSNCCGFFQPSHNLVNAFKTDAAGLPRFDNYDNADIVNVDPGSPQGVPDNQFFVAEAGTLDPRLDWTVGRKSIDFLGHGPFGGLSWIRDPSNGGSYMAAKHVYSADQEGVTGAGWTKGFTAVPTNIIRYAEVLLWRAEIAARENDLSLALQYVNEVRARSANPAQFVKNEDGTNAANYLLGLYPSFPSQAYAIEAVEFEYRLETALEGHRFFDLVRRNRAVDVLTEYVRDENQRTYLTSVSSFPPRSIYFPIPSNIISLSGGSLQQNDGY